MHYIIGTTFTVPKVKPVVGGPTRLDSKQPFTDRRFLPGIYTIQNIRNKNDEFYYTFIFTPEDQNRLAEWKDITFRSCKDADYVISMFRGEDLTVSSPRTD